MGVPLKLASIGTNKFVGGLAEGRRPELNPLIDEFVREIGMHGVAKLDCKV